MELLSKTLYVDGLAIEIAVHAASRGAAIIVPAQPPLYVRLTARDAQGNKIWTTALLGNDGTIKYFSSVAEALTEATNRIGSQRDMISGSGQVTPADHG